jgi:hypothetical protein
VELRREYSSGGRKERQCGAVECVKEVERDSWVSFKAKRSTAQVEQLLAKLGGARGSSGDGGVMWRSRERASAGWEAAGTVLERHVAQRRAARGSWGSENQPARAAGSAQRETERGGLQVDEGGLICNSPKVQGLYYKVELTFKP